MSPTVGPAASARLPCHAETRTSSVTGLSPPAASPGKGGSVSQGAAPAQASRSSCGFVPGRGAVSGPQGWEGPEVSLLLQGGDRVLFLFALMLEKTTLS